MKFVKQKHKDGCAIASLAMVTGLSYDKVLHKVHPNYLKYKCASVKIKNLSKLLCKFNINNELIVPINFKKLDTSALVILISSLTGQKENHLVVWNYKKQKIYDPIGIITGRVRSYERGAFILIKLTNK